MRIDGGNPRTSPTLKCGSTMGLHNGLRFRGRARREENERSIGGRNLGTNGFDDRGRRLAVALQEVGPLI